MQKIASPQELQAELKSILAFVHGHGPDGKPNRSVVAGKLRALADRVAMKYSPTPTTDVLNEKTLVEFLRKHPSHAITAEELAYSFGGHHQKHQWFLKQLVGKGVLEKAGRGYKLRELADRVAATRYEWEGKLHTPAQLATKAQYKEISKGSRGYNYEFVMKGEAGGDATVFKVPRGVWEKAKLPDKTPARVKDAVAEEEIKKLTKGLSMSDAVDFNTWVKKEKPSSEKKLEWLRRH